MKMRNSIYIIIISFGIWVLTIGLSESNQVRIPHSKIKKSVKKYLKIQNFSLLSIEDNDETFSQSKIFEIKTDTVIVGYVYVSRVNSCRAGGCSITPSDNAIEFEYFDYYFITDTHANVVNVKVFNYQATHGHQIMSRGWLKQFVGYGGNQSLLYGKDIQAISGATISAKTLIDDIQKAELVILDIINN